MKPLVRYLCLGLALALFLPPAAAQRQRPAMRTGHIEIVTDPPGFEIFVNGTKRPERSNATLELAEGRYEIELVWPASSYRHPFAVELVPGDVLTQRFDMRGVVPVGSQSAPAAQRQRRAVRTGYMEIITDPPGFEIFVDGAKRQERTNANIELLEGKRQIDLYLPATSYRHSFSVEMMPADILQQRFDMRGSLRVDSFWVQDGSKSAGPTLELHLDGKPISQGQSIDKLVAGTHELRVRHGSVEKTRLVEIRPGSALQVNYSVERGPDPGRVPF